MKITKEELDKMTLKDFQVLMVNQVVAMDINISTRLIISSNSSTQTIYIEMYPPMYSEYHPAWHVKLEYYDDSGGKRYPSESGKSLTDILATLLQLVDE